MSARLSLSLLVAAASRTAADLWLVSIGRGPATFAVPAGPTAAGPASHYGAHTYDDGLLELLRGSAEAEAIGIEWLWAEGRTAAENFAFLLASRGVVPIEVAA
jgi:hypothetical protein